MSISHCSVLQTHVFAFAACMKNCKGPMFHTNFTRSSFSVTCTAVFKTRMIETSGRFPLKNRNNELVVRTFRQGKTNRGRGIHKQSDPVRREALCGKGCRWCERLPIGNLGHVCSLTRFTSCRLWASRIF